MKYKVGDKVKIKTWEQMEKEFGVSSFGTINCSLHFTRKMEKAIPGDRVAQITCVVGGSWGEYYRTDIYRGVYNVTDDMIEGLARENIPKETYDFKEELI